MLTLIFLGGLISKTSALGEAKVHLPMQTTPLSTSALRSSSLSYHVSRGGFKGADDKSDPILAPKSPKSSS